MVDPMLRSVAPEVLDQDPPTGPPVPDGPSVTTRTPRSRWWAVVEIVLGAAVVGVVGLTLSMASDPTAYRPGVLLLGTVVAVAVLAGLRAGIAAAVVAAGFIWYQFTTPTGSLALGGSRDAISVLVFSLTAGGVLLLVARTEASRRREADQRRVTDALLDEAPVGIAMFDRRLRLERMNQKLGRILRMDPTGHLGRRPTEINAAIGEVYEPFLAQVRDERTPLEDRMVSTRDERSGTEFHWRTNYYPVEGRHDDVIGVGVVVEDVTGDLVARRRSERLMRLARDLAEAADMDDLVAATTSFLADAFTARAAVAVAEPDGSGFRVLLPTAGYSDAAEDRWRDEVTRLGDRTPLAEAARSRRIVTVASAARYDERYPDNAPRRLLIGDEACILVPVLEPREEREVLAVLRVGWAHPRVLTPTSETLCETVASMVALAMNRIRLAEAVARDRFRSALDAMLDEVAIGRAVRDESGEIVDFVIEFMNSHSRDGADRPSAELVGGRVCELYPGWRESGMFERFRTVVETGVPFQGERLPYHDVMADGSAIRGYWNLQVVRLDDGYIAASRDVTDLVRADRARRDAEAARSREQLAVQLLQRAALPADMPDVEGVEIGAHYQPAANEQPIGGDWYDAFRRDDGSVGLVMADVAGHGADAASFMVQVRNIFRAVAIECEDPAEVMARVNHVTTGFNRPGGPFVTCCYGLLDVAAGTLSWCLGGHPPPLVLHGGASTFPNLRPGPPLALFDDATYTSATIDVGGGRLVLYTDGLVERRGEVLDVGLERMAEVAAACSDLDAAAAAKALGDSVPDPFDDLAVMVVDVRPRRS